MNLRRQLRSGRIAGRDTPADGNDAEDAALILRPGWVASQHFPSQPLAEAVDLTAWRAEACQFNHGGLPQMQSRPQRQMLQLKADRCDVFAELSGLDEMSTIAKLGKQFGRDEMNLTFVGSRGQSFRNEPMLRVLARVRISDDAVIFDERNAWFYLFPKLVL